MIYCLIKRQFTFIFISLIILRIDATNLDFRLACFIPESKLFRTIYNTANLSYQIEVSKNIFDCFQLWSNISFIHSSGKSFPIKIPTSLRLISFGFGGKYIYHLNMIDLFAGAGICFTWLKENNNFNLCNKANNVGGIFKFGIEKQYKCLKFLFFVDYMLQSFNVKNPVQCKKVNASGLFLGAGIGINF